MTAPGVTGAIDTTALRERISGFLLGISVGTFLGALLMDNRMDNRGSGAKAKDGSPPDVTSPPTDFRPF